MGIGRRAGIIGTARAVHLALRQQLGMDFQSYYSLVVHGFYVRNNIFSIATIGEADKEERGHAIRYQITKIS